MSIKEKIIFGFHAINSKIIQNSSSIKTLYIDISRNDNRMKNIIKNAKLANIHIISINNKKLFHIAKTHNHQGVVAKIKEFSFKKNLYELLDSIKEPLLLLILDEITDPHNLGACLRVADGAGVHAIISTKNNSVGLNATVAKVSSGAIETIPFFTVTNLSNTLCKLKERNIYLIGASNKSKKSLYNTNFLDSSAIIMGSEKKGLRHLTKKNCDILINIPMSGLIESLNVSVAAGIILFEARRQRIINI
ncbi:tRNA/rRNA methyltransferase [Candidatus Profftella armatura]|uniref:tRNA/rRNA methyltransferase n=1 Tax=Candidatus Profftella armatura TaxID=669502 RepID=S5RQ12_9PROT|nr:tRNA/rRNA methyltransferase [Candidatus Profftella armatura]